MIDPPSAELVQRDVERALQEDVGSGDVSAMLLPDLPQEASVLCRDPAVIAGRPWFDACFLALDPRMQIEWHVAEGDRVSPGTTLCTLRGAGRALVSGERAALNFLQTLSGTATVTASYVDALAGTGTRVLDTRKTLPGLRLAQKYAVRAGGGMNHRLGLHDAVMIKENHVIAAGSISAAMAQSRRLNPGVPMIVEVEDLDELDEALAGAPDRILLDEFDSAQLREAVRRVAGRVALEVSGNVTLDTIAGVAASGVDFISVGALTKHVRAVDLSLRLGTRPEPA